MKPIKFIAILALTVILARSGAKAQNDQPDKKLYQHVLLFKWKDNTDPDQKAKLLKLFKGLPTKIEGFERIDMYDVTKSSGDFDQVMVLQFVSEEALARYEAHPDHQRISEIGPPLLSGFSEFNYWR